MTDNEALLIGKLFQVYDNHPESLSISIREAVQKVIEERKPKTPEQIFAEDIKQAHFNLQCKAKGALACGIEAVTLDPRTFQHLLSFLSDVESALRKYNV